MRKAEHTCVNTMGTGRLYNVVEDGKVIGEFFVSEDEVCDILNERHSSDKEYEGAWDASEEEYESVYAELSSAFAENY